MELLKPSGGKIHVFMSSLPNCGTKALKLRDGQSNVSDKEKQTGLLPQDNTYMTLSAQAADYNVRHPTPNLPNVCDLQCVWFAKTGNTDKLGHVLI